jgi:hypothetical protein
LSFVTSYGLTHAPFHTKTAHPKQTVTPPGLSVSAVCLANDIPPSYEERISRLPNEGKKS